MCNFSLKKIFDANIILEKHYFAVWPQMFDTDDKILIDYYKKISKIYTAKM